MGDEIDFLPANKRKSFLEVDIITLACLIRYAQSTQNNKLTISQGKCEG